MRWGIRQTLAPALVAVAATLAACSGGSGPAAGGAGAIVLGISQVDTVPNWNAANTESIRKAARDGGVELRLEDARRSQENQIASLRSFMRQHVTVIAFSPVVETGWEIVLREIRTAGIPVILMDRAIEVSDESLYVSLVGSDFVEQGRLAGRWLLEHTRDIPGEVDIVELQGTVGSAPANDRKQGFAETIAADPRYRIIRSQSGDFSRESGKRIMENFLQAEGRRIRVLFSHNDPMALGAIEAIEAAGIKPGSEILVISIEGSRAAFKAMVEGKLNVTVESSPLLGPQLIATVKDVAAGRPVPRHIVTRESVFSRETAAEELPKRHY
jgi:simple sugar transport system substrate-binding protein